MINTSKVKITKFVKMYYYYVFFYQKQRIFQKYYINLSFLAIPYFSPYLRLQKSIFSDIFYILSYFTNYSAINCKYQV